MKFIAALCCCVLLVSGCGDESQPAQAAQPAEATTQTRNVVDSIFPMDVMIARFQAEVPRKPVDFGQDAPLSMEELIERLVQAMADSSEQKLNGLALDVSEFAYLYFPTSKLAGAQYRQPPALGWMLTEQNSMKGRQRALALYGGKPMPLAGYGCEAEPVTEGANRLWSECRVRIRGVDSPIRLFGTVIERGGRFKVISLANDL